MQLQDFYPIIVTDKLVACRDFYQRYFDLALGFESSWFIWMHSHDQHASIGFMHPEHPSAPPGPEPFNGKGMCLEFQVADAQAEYQRLLQAGAAISYALQDEPFGQRRFGLFDPAGTWIDVVEQIEPAAGWWEQYLITPETAENKPETGFLALLSSPARSALEHEGITTLTELAKYSEREILKLHGVGPRSIPTLREALLGQGLTFRDAQD